LQLAERLKMPDFVNRVAKQRVSRGPCTKFHDYQMLSVNEAPALRLVMNQVFMGKSFVGKGRFRRRLRVTLRRFNALIDLTGILSPFGGTRIS
jgi:hypothetical protein